MKPLPEMKQEAIDWLDRHEEFVKRLSNTVWVYAESPLQEFRCAALLTRQLEGAGFKIEREAGGLETAFVATYGSGSPVIATYAEYDATEGLSQLPVPYPAPVVQGAGGFQDMHNGLGVGAVSAALAVKELMERNKIPGTLKVFGTPAEKLSIGKPFMARAGLFNGLDAVISWHPGTETEAEPGWGYRFLAFEGRRFIFKGQSIFGATPWDGTSALEGITLMDVAVQFMRVHVLPPDARFTINHIVCDGGQAPTNYPGRAEAWYHFRAIKREYIDRIREGLLRCAKGAATASNTVFETKFVSATHENLPNIVLAKAMHQNIEHVGAPKFTESDRAFAREIEKTLGREPSPEPFNLTITPPTGAMKVGVTDDFTEFTRFAPTHRVYVTYKLATGTPSWSTAAFAAMNVGHQAEIAAAKYVACTILDLFLNPQLLMDAKREFAERSSRDPWKCLIPADEPTPRRPHLPEEHYRAMREGCKQFNLQFME